MMRTVTLITPILLTAAACNEPRKPGVPALHKERQLTSLSWLEGFWQDKDGDGIVFEQWRKLDDSTLSGRAGFIRHKDTQVAENIQLRERDGVLYYVPTVRNQNGGKPVLFRYTGAAGDSFSFSNEGHDFPQIITYRRITNDSVLAGISGNDHGQPRREVFPMRRVNSGN